MSNESENKLARRVDDKRADVPLEWSEAANVSAVPASAPAPREVPEYTGLDAMARVFADAANTSGQVVLSAQSCDLLYRAMTTPLATPVAPAVPAPSQVPAELSEERIDSIAKPFAGMGGVEDYRSFARAIERELRAGSSDVRDQAPVESATDEAMKRACKDLPERYTVRVELERDAGCVSLKFPNGDVTDIEGEGYLSDDINEAIDAAIKAKAPAASKEGGEQ
jgi:hypothetical protein